MTLEQGTLTLRPRTQRNGQHFAIDTFFSSLAHDRQQQAIGVLLSGTASDGTLGLQAIKAAGGITFARDAHTAAFPQMPQNAIDAGCVDRVLPPEETARELARFSVHPYVAQPEEITELPPGRGAIAHRSPPTAPHRERRRFPSVQVRLAQAAHPEPHGGAAP